MRCHEKNEEKTEKTKQKKKKRKIKEKNEKTNEEWTACIYEHEWIKMESLCCMIKYLPCFLATQLSNCNKCKLTFGKMHLAHHHLYYKKIYHLQYSKFSLLQIILLIITITLLLHALQES